jgi:hypothetical protein
VSDPSLTDANRKRRIEAALGLARSGHFQGLDVIVQCLSDADEEVRLDAADASMHIGFTAALDPLSAMIRADPMSDNRSQAIYALVGLGRPAVVPVLVGALGDDDIKRRQDARAALYRVLGREVVPLLGDEDGGENRDPDEIPRTLAWWETQAQNFRAEWSYVQGKPGSPGALIEALKASPSEWPDAILNALEDWTGRNLGERPLSEIVADWERWWTDHRDEYELGRRYFYGYRVP